jgi:CheY-like chemotaxis protein
VTGTAGRKADKADKARKIGTGPVPVPISLVLIDDNRLLREGIAALILAQPGFKVLATFADPEEALKEVRKAAPDVVLLDFGLEDHDSLSLTATVHGEVPSARVIVMGLLPLQEDVADFVRAGASGFIMKDASAEDFFRHHSRRGRWCRGFAQGADHVALRPNRPECGRGEQGAGRGCGPPDQPGTPGH